MRVVIVIATIIALLGVTLWVPHVAVVEVKVASAGLEKKKVRLTPGKIIPDEKDPKGPARIVPEERTEVIHPAKGERVVAYLGRYPIIANLKPSITNENGSASARIDWTRLFAEYALILACAAFFLRWFASTPATSTSGSGTGGAAHGTIQAE